jgi:hypothetical protein
MMMKTSGLLHRAIIQSGVCSTAFVTEGKEHPIFISREESQEVGKAAAVEGCADLSDRTR